MRTRRHLAVTFLTVSLGTLAGCAGPPVRFDGPSSVEIVNRDTEPHVVRLVVETGGTAHVDQVVDLAPDARTEIDASLPGRTLLGTREYDVTVEVDDGNVTTETISYGDGWNSFAVFVNGPSDVEIHGVRSA